MSPSCSWIRACKRPVAAADEQRVKALGFLFAAAEALVCVRELRQGHSSACPALLCELDISILPRQCPLPCFSQPGLNIAANFGGD